MAQAPIILRPEIEGVDPRYAAYAQSGPYLHPSQPLTLNTGTERILIFAPSNAQSARLIVFSHAALADPFTYRDLLWHWASHGFVVAAPLHNDAILEEGPTLRVRSDGDYSLWPIATLLQDPMAWKRRLDECGACLDHHSSLEAMTGLTIDIGRTIIAGHGYGAYLASLIMGATVTDGDGVQRSFRDDRFFASIAMSPPGPGVMGQDEQSWINVTSPGLVLLAENDNDFTGQPWQVKADVYNLAQEGYKHLGLLKGATTNSYSGQRAYASPAEEAIFQVIKAFTTGFLKAYGEYDQTAFADLTSNFFQRMSLGTVQEFRR